MEAINTSNYFHISLFMALIILSTYDVFCKCLEKRLYNAEELVP